MKKKKQKSMAAKYRFINFFMQDDICILPMDFSDEEIEYLGQFFNITKQFFFVKFERK